MGKALAIFNVVLVLGYPLAVYLGLTHLNARSASLLLLLLLSPGLVQKLRSASRDRLKSVAALPLSIFTLVALSAWLDNPRFVFALPVLINGALLAQFVASLRTTPMVERFARLQEPELSLAQVAYCRRVTLVWASFFAVNAAVSASLAWLASVATWALYNGVIAYVLIGILGASEYIVRKAKFREYGSGLHDRLIARVFPPRSAEQTS